MAVVDASVWVAIFHAADPAHSRCVGWLDSALASGERLLAPALLVPEVAAAVRRLTGDQVLASKVVDQLLALGVLELHSLDPRRAARAATLATASGVRAADAVYLALAQEREDVLVTIDRQQCERGAGLVRIQEP